LALPIVFLLSVKLSSVILDRNFDAREMMLCLAAILATVAAIFLIAWYRQRTNKKPSSAST
jgi:membrane protein DedA with SNARE-associated domain